MEQLQAERQALQDELARSEQELAHQSQALADADARLSQLQETVLTDPRNEVDPDIVQQLEEQLQVHVLADAQHSNQPDGLAVYSSINETARSLNSVSCQP